MYIKDVTNNKIIYRCQCGAVGQCLIRPQDTKAVIVFDLKCPHCLEVTRLKLTSHLTKHELDKADMTWAIIINNDLIEDD